MIRCGQGWQPTIVLRVIEPILSSTCVVKVATDAGIGFVKGMGNPQGNESLALELVGSELAALVGLTVPPFAIVDIAGMTIEMFNGAALQFGPAFISREWQPERRRRDVPKTPCECRGRAPPSRIRHMGPEYRSLPAT